MCGPTYDIVEPHKSCNDCSGALYLTPNTRKPFCPACQPPRSVTVSYDEHLGRVTIVLADGVEVDVYTPVKPDAPVSIAFWAPVKRGDYPVRSEIHHFYVKEELK